MPDELLDAGRIDGLSEFGLFWRVALPLVRQALAALAILTFLGNWNAFLWPLIVTQDQSMYTIPVGVALFSGEAGSQWNLITTAASLSVFLSSSCLRFSSGRSSREQCVQESTSLELLELYTVSVYRGCRKKAGCAS